MIRFCIAYRFADNSVSGYIGYGFDAMSAERNAKDKAREACATRGESVSWDRFIEKPKGLNPAELRKVRADWRTIRADLKRKGASIY